FKEAFGATAGSLPGETGTEVVINPVAGSVSVLATEKQHNLVQQYLDSVLASVQRQVLIEATIAEVRLSDAFQSGVDWSRILPTGGLRIEQSLSTFAAGTTPALLLRYTNPVGNFTATLKLLEQFGNTRVLSSPKLMALNNQTALLKVVDNVVYFSIETNTVANTNTPAVTTFNTTAHTVPVGVVMSVTPQINENGQVALTVRPTISRILRFKNDPNPALSASTLTATITNPVPEIQVREMESVLQVNSGQAVILGGLMQDDTTKTRDQIPGLGGLPGIGDLFAYRNENTTKTELVIFLRPTVIPNPTLDSDELKFFQRYLPQVESAKQP
ncbi:MAG: pilus (MSHA type) biogenesis protein MshL, partial [Pseudomonadota bacterium]